MSARDELLKLADRFIAAAGAGDQPVEAGQWIASAKTALEAAALLPATGTLSEVMETVHALLLAYGIQVRPEDGGELGINPTDEQALAAFISWAQGKYDEARALDAGDKILADELQRIRALFAGQKNQTADRQVQLIDKALADSESALIPF